MLNSPCWEDEAGGSVRSTYLVDEAEEAGEDAATKLRSLEVAKPYFWFKLIF